MAANTESVEVVIDGRSVRRLLGARATRAWRDIKRDLPAAAAQRLLADAVARSMRRPAGAQFADRVEVGDFALASGKIASHNETGYRRVRAMYEGSASAARPGYWADAKQRDEVAERRSAVESAQVVHPPPPQGIEQDSDDEGGGFSGSGVSAVRFIPAERSVARKFTVTMPEIREAHRREGELVEAYLEHLTELGLSAGRLELSGEDTKLLNDVYVPERNQLIEAKGDVRRDMIRMAIGQLADYTFQMKRSSDYSAPPACAILLPGKAGASVEQLLTSLEIALVWRTSDGAFNDNRAGKFTT